MPAAPAFLRHAANGARLRQLRSDAGLSQQVLATRAGLSLRTLILAESAGLASRRTLDALAGVLRVPVEELDPRQQPPAREVTP